MKYNLTINDLTAAQVTDLMNRVENETTITSVVATIPEAYRQIADSTEPLNTIANQNVEAANSIMNDSTDELLKSAGGLGEVDSENLPWDGRIHSGSRKKNADGKWKLRKNIADADVSAVKNELLARAMAPTPAAPVAAIKAPEPPAFLRREIPAANASAPVTVPAMPVAPVAAPVAPIMAAPQPAPTRDFSGLMMQVSKLFATKQITPDYPKTIVDRVNAGFHTNIATLTDVANDARMVEYSWQCLEVDGKAA